MNTTDSTTEVVEEIPADLITPPDMPSSIQGFAPIAEGIEMTALGLKITSEHIEAQDFHKLFNSAIALSRASSWLIGDTLNLADRKWGNKHTGTKYEEAAQRTGLSVVSLKQFAWVCKAIPLNQRRDDLSFTHHLDVCGTADNSEEREKLLSEAKEQQMSAKAFRKHLRQVKAVKANKDAWENGTENLDRPFGIMDVSDSDNMKTYPMMTEITRVTGWFSGRDLRKLKAAERQEMLGDLAPLISLAYGLFQVELKANPFAKFELPFDIKSMDELPPAFMLPQPELPDDDEDDI